MGGGEDGEWESKLVSRGNEREGERKWRVMYLKCIHTELYRIT